MVNDARGTFNIFFFILIVELEVDIFYSSLLWQFFFCLEDVWKHGWIHVFKIFKIFFLLFIYILNSFDVLILKIIFKN